MIAFSLIITLQPSGQKAIAAFDVSPDGQLEDEGPEQVVCGPYRIAAPPLPVVFLLQHLPGYGPRFRVSADMRHQLLQIVRRHPDIVVAEEDPGAAGFPDAGIALYTHRFFRCQTDDPELVGGIILRFQSILSGIYDNDLQEWISGPVQVIQ